MHPRVTTNESLNMLLYTSRSDGKNPHILIVINAKGAQPWLLLVKCQLYEMPSIVGPNALILPLWGKNKPKQKKTQTTNQQTKQKPTKQKPQTNQTKRTRTTPPKQNSPTNTPPCTPPPPPPPPNQANKSSRWNIEHVRAYVAVSLLRQLQY